MELSIDRHCRKCGKEFFAFRANQQYCSARCRERAWGEREIIKIKKETHTCKKCGESFETNDKRKIFCSRKCRIRHFNELRPTTKSQQRECPQCHKIFIPMQTRGVGKTYCSSKCQRRFNYIKNHKTILERTRAWHKKNKWCGSWEQAIKRDKYTCQMCHKTIYPSQWSANNRIEVHHKDGSGEKESKNHQLNNLITLCLQCHREFHTKINLVQINGKFFVRGKIFDLLRIKTIETLGDS